MDDERTEDLNPHNEDIEEKIKQMLDPSIPDVPEEAIKTESLTPKKDIEIQAVSTPVEDEAPAVSTPSAPELPSAGKKSLVTKSKKVTIAVTHHDEDIAGEVQTTDKAVKPKAKTKKAADLKKDTEERGSAPEVKKINIAEHSESPEVVAEKLDEAIAELEQDNVTPEDATPPTTEPEEAAEDVNPNEPVDADPPLAEPAVIASPETDKAVEDIVAAESDELLEVEDAVRDTDEPVKPIKKPRGSLLKAIKSWLAKPLVRWVFVILILAAIVATIFFPNSRYFVLNTVGVRVNSSMIVLDESTGQPLKNVEVKIGAASSLSDAEGKVNLRKVKLGKAQLSLQKRAFAPVTKTIIVGLGSNPLGETTLKPTGSQYSFTVVDFLSGKPIGKIEASSGDATALSDDQGIIKLTIDQSNDEPVQVALKGASYRTEQIAINPDDKADHVVKFVPDRKNTFVSKRSGKYDIYSVYIDGKDEKLVLAGSGHERDDLVLVPHKTANIVAYVSTRANQPNKEGFLLSNLIFIDTSDNTTTNIAQSERIRIVDWSDDRLIYVMIAAGSSANDPKRYRLMSHDYKDGSSKELASSNFFNDVIAVNGAIYYAPSSAYQSGGTGLFKLNSDGSGAVTLFDQEVWNIFRTSYDTVTLSVQQQWYEYRFGDKVPSKLNSAPASQISRVYSNSPDATHSAWIDKRDGKGVLLAYDTAAKSDTVLKSQSGLEYPVNWLNDGVIVYRVKTDQETADYAISIRGGEPKKIGDVTNAGGINSTY